MNGNPVNYIDPEGNVPVPVITGAIGGGLGLLSTYAGDVIGNVFDPEVNGINVLKPTSSLGTYAGNIAGGAIAGATFNGAGLASMIGFSIAEAGISTGIKYGVDATIDYTDNGVMKGIYSTKNIVADFAFNAAGNLGGGLIAKGAQNLLPNVKIINTPNRAQIKQSLRESGMKGNFGDAIRNSRVGYSKINEALTFGPFDKFSGAFIGNMLQRNTYSKTSDYK